MNKNQEKRICRKKGVGTHSSFKIPLKNGAILYAGILLVRDWKFSIFGQYIIET